MNWALVVLVCDLSGCTVAPPDVFKDQQACSFASRSLEMRLEGQNISRRLVRLKCFGIGGMGGLGGNDSNVEPPAPAPQAGAVAAALPVMAALGRRLCRYAIDPLTDQKNPAA